MEVIVEAKEVYGNTLYYPVNAAAGVLATLANTKTLTPLALFQAGKLGLKICEKWGRPIPVP